MILTKLKMGDLVANKRALKYHIRRAKEISKGGIIGINIMQVKELVEKLVEETKLYIK